jgi:hypothetical protein
MKNLLVFGIVAVALALAMPAMAEESQDLYALSKLTVSPPQMLTDRQLESVEGAAACGFFCTIRQGNTALVGQNNSSTQVNAALGSLIQANLADQSNRSNVTQRNR